MKLLYNFKNSRISSVVIINGLNLLSSFQQGIFPELVRPKGNCKDISLSILFYSSVAKSDTRIRWSIYQMILAWIVIQLLNPFPFHYNTCYNSHQRAFSKENYNTVCIMTYIYVLCIIPIINISIYVLLIISIQTMKGGQKMQDKLAFNGNGRRSAWTPQERQSSSDSYTASSPSESCWNFISLELSWEVF